MKIAIINGPNLNLIGRREPEIYGDRSLNDYLRSLAEEFPEVELIAMQSNHEGDIIDKIHIYGYDDSTAGIILNPGALAHYSYALADAIRSVPAKTLEVHISNIFAREEFRSKSVTAAACAGAISGFGLEGYRMAVRYLIGNAGLLP